jgi:hypothetical protein
VNFTKKQLLEFVRAFVALLHTDTDKDSQIAALKAQVQAMTEDSKLSDAEAAEVNAAVNMLGAATPPTVADVQTVAAIAPADAPDPNAVKAATDAIPQDVQTAAAAEPTPAGEQAGASGPT